MSMPDAGQRPGPKELLKQLREQPISEISAVVGACGAGGSRGKGETLWTFTVTVAAWKVHGGELRTEELIVRREVTDEELANLQSFFPAFKVVCFRARLAERSVLGRADA